MHGHKSWDTAKINNISIYQIKQETFKHHFARTHTRHRNDDTFHFLLLHSDLFPFFLFDRNDGSLSPFMRYGIDSILMLCVRFKQIYMQSFQKQNKKIE